MSIVFAPARTLVCLALTLTVVTAEPALAAPQDGPAAAALTPAPEASLPQTDALVPRFAAGPATSPAIFQTAPPPASRRPAALVPLYISLASLQTLDIDSTMKGLRSGGVEANPIMRGVVGSPPAMVALKATFTGLLIASSEKLWKKNRVAAVLLMVGMNGLHLAVVSHNYSVTRR